MRLRLSESVSFALAGVLATLFVGTALGCSSSESPSAPAQVVATSDAGDVDAGAELGDAGGDPSTAQNVGVEFGSQSTEIDVMSLERQDYRGTQVVSLTRVWEAANFGTDVATLQFDFEGDDGFHPTSRDRCKTLIQGSQIPQGYILPETRTLIWDDALGLPGCYSVKGVAKIIASSAK